MIVRSNLNKKFLFSAIAGLIIVSVLFMPLAIANLWWREVFNSGHTVLFVFISYILYFWLTATFRFTSAAVVYLVVLVMCLLLGIAIGVACYYFVTDLVAQLRQDSLREQLAVLGPVADEAVLPANPTDRKN